MKNHLFFFGKVLLAVTVINAIPQLGNITGAGNKFFK